MACIQFKFRFNIREAAMMPTLNRLTGRFFTVLISLSLAILVPRAAFAGGGTKKALSPTLCQISDTVYRADGSPAQGTVLLSWQAFTTAAGQAVSPGSLLVTLDANGGFNASVAPNTGASPAGTYYKAIFKLSDGTTETEFWVVPNTQTTTIGAIRSKLVPSQQAAQFLTRDFADSNYVGLASTQSITGLKTFSASPAVPTPQNPTDAANKSYVDANSGSGNLASPPPIGNVAPNSVNATALTAQSINGMANAGFGATTTAGPNDIGVKVNAAFASCGNNCPVYIGRSPTGTWTTTTPIVVPVNPNAELFIDAGAKVNIQLSSGYGVSCNGPASLNLDGCRIVGGGTFDGTGSTGTTTGGLVKVLTNGRIEARFQNFPGDGLLIQGANTV